MASLPDIFECCVCYDNFTPEEVIRLLCCKTEFSQYVVCGTCIAFMYAENMKNMSYSSQLFKHKCPHCNVPLKPSAISVWKDTYERVFSDEERKQIEEYWHKPLERPQERPRRIINRDNIITFEEYLRRIDIQRQQQKEKDAKILKKTFDNEFEFEETEKNKRKWELKNPTVSKLDYLIDGAFMKPKERNRVSNEVSKFAKRYPEYFE